MTCIDIDSLRDYMANYYGTAMWGGFPAAILDLADVSKIQPEKLCQLAESEGIDLRKFIVDESDD